MSQEDFKFKDSMGTLAKIDGNWQNIKVWSYIVIYLQLSWVITLSLGWLYNEIVMWVNGK